ncbi:hypothetical protein BST91_08740 [Nonlabens tegetincola]|uniref:T9SS type A sorting domain-containing protein n=1 Tax=Nonlabens tegetincola TaxID=323273 RepID=UPI000A207007|nr:T9SS type A sorting domain-containing protein [Nonlabens tegetincola]ARN71723.1 hypothetical protein BST91_08740 [Nonlabens tegetincola]
MKTQLLLIAFLISMFTSAQVYVNANATGANDGTSWTDAYTDLNTATASSSNTEIWIAAGTYSPGTSVGDRITCATGTELYGGFIGNETSLSQRDWLANPTIIDGDVNGDDTGTLSYSNPTKVDNNYRLSQVAGSGVVYDGLIFKNAAALGSSNSSREGSAMIIQKDTKIRNCIFEDNIAIRGGTISIGGPQTGATAEIINCQFQNNLASFANTFYSDRDDVSLLMVNTLIANNRNTSFTAGGFGNLLWFRPPSGSNNLTMTNCTITDNFYDNQNSQSAHIRIDGIGNNGEYKLHNNIIYNNEANSLAIRTENNANPTLIEVLNNVEENNFSNISNNGTSRINLATAISNPNFTDPVNDDYTLGNNSSAINSGNNNLYLSSFPNIDLAGNGRFAASSIDRGAYESNSTAGPSRPTIYVNMNASGNNDGSSWNDAFTQLEDAFNAGSGSDIWIASGTYLRPSNANKFYIWNIQADSHLYGGFNGTETTLNQRDIVANPTIISGDFNNDDATIPQYGAGIATKSDNNVRLAVVRGPSVTIDGITFTGGHAFDQNLNEGAALTIAIDTKVTNCIFENNAAQRSGAAIRVYDITGINSGVNTISNCIFRRNRAWFATAVYTFTTQGNYKLELLGCSFEENNTGLSTQTNNPAGIVWLRNEASNNVQSDFDAINCTVAGNTGTHNDNSRYPHFRLSKLQGDSEYRSFNNIFWANTQTRSSGAISTPVFSVSGGNRTFTIDTNIDEDAFSNLSSTAINTINNSPGFIDPSMGDYRITSTSAAAGIGNFNLASTGVPSTDYFNQSRGNSNNWDLGAYSSTSTAHLEENTSPALNIYPNPATHRVNIELKDNTIATAQLFNLTGQLLIATNQSTLDISNLPSGMYLLHVKTSNGQYLTNKLIKK